MSHSYTKIWLHAVFGTKYRQSLIKRAFEETLHNHIRHHLEDDFGCHIRAINGTEDHVHILFLVDPKYAVKDLLKNIKGESSHWMNQQNLTTEKFAWQIGYGALSVSESNVNQVERYIRNQKEHHRQMTFLEEYENFVRMHGLALLLQTVETV